MVHQCGKVRQGRRIDHEYHRKLLRVRQQVGHLILFVKCPLPNPAIRFRFAIYYSFNVFIIVC
jgi:hypothetical protein